MKNEPSQQNLEQLYYQRGIHFAAMIDFLVFSIVILFLTYNFIYFLVPFAISVLHWFLFFKNEEKIQKIGKK